MTFPSFNFSQPVVDGDGFASKPLRDWMLAVASAVNAGATATATVPASRNVVTVGGLHGGGALSADIGLRLYKAVTTVALLPMSGNANGDMAYALNGRKPGEAAAAGTGTVVFWSRTAWIAVTSGVAVTA